VIAPGAFHDQDVDLFLRESGRLHDRLVVEVDVAGVKNRAPFGAQQNSRGAEHMAGIKEFKRKLLAIPRRNTFTGNIDALAHWARLPEIGGALGFTMREQRIEHDPELFPLPRHDVDRVMQ